MTPRELAAQRAARERQSSQMRQRASEGVRTRTGGGGFEPARREPAAPAEESYVPPAPVTADELGGALEDPTSDTRIEVGPDMIPRRVPKNPGPQSGIGGFGDLLASADANDLVNIVRQDRMARHAQRIPTFGDVAAAKPPGMMQTPQPAPPPMPAPEAAPMDAPEQAAAAPPVRFLVDAKTGEFEPIIGATDVQPGPGEILVETNGEQANVIATGKNVRDIDIAKLQDPKRGMQPALRKGYQIPPEYAGIAEALGVKA